MINARNWRSFAACCNVSDKELFFPIGNTAGAQQWIDDAKSVCRRCDAVEFCRDWALDTNQDAGVWGAMSEDERRALKRRESRLRQRAAAGADEQVLAEQAVS